MRTKGSAAELERRRKLAVQRVHDGYPATEVARFLGVHLRTVRWWLAAAREDPRLAHLIQKRFGVHFHPRYVNAWLRQRGITPQKPQRQPRERDPEAIDRWL